MKRSFLKGCWFSSSFSLKLGWKNKNIIHLKHQGNQNIQKHHETFKILMIN